MRYPNADLFLSRDFNSRIGDQQDFISFDDLQFVFGESEYPTDSFGESEYPTD